MKQTEILTHATHVNGWFPAVYMSCMSQNFRLFHVSNLSVRNFRIFLLMYTGSVRAGVDETTPSERPPPTANRKSSVFNAFSGAAWIHIYLRIHFVLTIALNTRYELSLISSWLQCLCFIILVWLATPGLLSTLNLQSKLNGENHHTKPTQIGQTFVFFCTLRRALAWCEYSVAAEITSICSVTL